MSLKPQSFPRRESHCSDNQLEAGPWFEPRTLSLKDLPFMTYTPWNVRKDAGSVWRMPFTCLWFLCFYSMSNLPLNGYWQFLCCNPHIWGTYHGPGSNWVALQPEPPLKLLITFVWLWNITFPHCNFYKPCSNRTHCIDSRACHQCHPYPSCKIKIRSTMHVSAKPGTGKDNRNRKNQCEPGFLSWWGRLWCHYHKPQRRMDKEGEQRSCHI